RAGGRPGGQVGQRVGIVGASDPLRRADGAQVEVGEEVDADGLEARSECRVGGRTRTGTEDQDVQGSPRWPDGKHMHRETKQLPSVHGITPSAPTGPNPWGRARPALVNRPCQSWIR